MTALFMDGYDHYGQGAFSQAQMLDGPYAQLGSVVCGVPSWGAARTGTNCLIGSNGNGNGLYKVLSEGAETDLYISFGWAQDVFVNFPNAMIGFSDPSGSTKCFVQPTATGAINICLANGTVIAGTSGPVLKTQNWHFIEMNLNTSTGAFTLRVDDTDASNAPVISVTDARLTGFSVGIVIIQYSAGSDHGSIYTDDLFIRNGSGSVNNAYLGDRRVATLFPATDTSTNNWAPSYYEKFGTGIYRGAYTQASNSTVQNQSATLAVQTGSGGAFNIGAADFTMETWIRFDALPSANNYASIFSNWNTSQSQQAYRLILGGSSFNNGCLQFDTCTDGTPSTQLTMIQYPWVPETDVWYFLTLCRTAGELLLFVDGVQLGVPITDSRTYFNDPTYFMVGQEMTLNSGPNILPNCFMAARLDETRITNGVGRYTSTFSPPSAAFPRGSSDPDWADVALLMGYDNAIIDESSYAHTIQISGGAESFLPSDGPALGSYSTVNKPIPDDNTFISADFTPASNVFTMTTQPTAGNTVTVGTTDGTTPAVYTFRSALVSAFDVLIDTSAQNTLSNLLNAINLGAGVGTKYGTGTTANFDVTGIPLPTGQFEVIANIAGTGGNSIASTHTGTAAAWNSTTLTGGLNIPGPTNFKLQRPPNNTTIISALQTVIRALKTDAGTATFETSFIGGLGGETTSDPFNLTISPNYYEMIIEEDPDSMGPVTPTTIVNGQVQVNRIA